MISKKDLEEISRGLRIVRGISDYKPRKNYNVECKSLTNILNGLKKQSPTSEELCMTLSEWFERDVKFVNEDMSSFAQSYFYYKEGNNYIYVLSINNGNVCTYTEQYPPHLITMIGQFYETLNR